MNYIDKNDFGKIRLNELKKLIKKVFPKKFNLKKILLVAPPETESSMFDYNIAKRGRANNYPPYGLAVVATNLRRKGYIVDIINLNHEVLQKVFDTSEDEFDFTKAWNDAVKNKIRAFQPDLIGVGCLFSVSDKVFKEVCDFIKKYFQNIPLMIGGVHVSHDVYGVLGRMDSPDFAILFEADIALPLFLDIIKGKNKIEEIGQFAFKNKKSEIFVFEKRLIPDTEIMDLRPAFDLIDISNHSKYGTLGSWHGSLKEDKIISTVQSNRGCRAACTFCNVRTYHGKTVRHKSIGAVVDELLELQNDYGVNHIVWLDDDLLKDEKRTIALFNLMVKKNIQMTWDATNGVIAHSLKKFEVVEAAYKSGCVGMHIGIESGNPEILRRIKKPGTVDTFLAAAEILKKFPEINVRGLLMLGFPNETLSQLFDTIELGENLNFDWYNLSILQPWKGTPIYDEMEESGHLGNEEGSLKDDETAPYQTGNIGRQRNLETGKILSDLKDEQLHGFLNRIKIKNMNEVPTKLQLDELWFYMNVRLNFGKLLKEKRKPKIIQQYNFTNYICNKTAPDNALGIYFFALMSYKLKGVISSSLIRRLDNSLKNEYWKSRFELFGLNLDQLVSKNFPAYITTGGVPQDFEGPTERFNFKGI